MDSRKHTTGELRVEESVGSPRSYALMGPLSDLRVVAVAYGPEGAARLKLAWNCHDDLLIALDGIISEVGHKFPKSAAFAAGYAALAKARVES